jgi:broad specificity phosphatase PhoE
MTPSRRVLCQAAGIPGERPQLAFSLRAGHPRQGADCGGLVPGRLEATAAGHPRGDMMLRMGELILIRHGETEWSRLGRHTGRTDVRLTEAGRAAAVALRPALAGRTISAVFTSPASRAIQTAGLAGLSDPIADPDLWEWDYGGYEGLTTDEIRQQRPGWYLWRDGVIPGDADHPGESVDSVGKRADAVLGRVRPLLARGDVALVAHGHMLRVLTARWLRLAPDDGRLFRLDTGTFSTLGTEHEEPIISCWNIPPEGAA